jgi:hypothetical protein
VTAVTTHTVHAAPARGGLFQPQAGPRQAVLPRPWAGKRTGRRAPRLWAAMPEGRSHGSDFGPTLCGGFYYVFQLFKFKIFFQNFKIHKNL